MHPQNCFITLTYRDYEVCTKEQKRKRQHLPFDLSLNKAHFQKFMKRLRKRFPDRCIRYYHCGEYGENYDRPHYHACLFNVDFADKELFKDDNGYLLFTSKLLEEIWSYGFVTIAELTFDSAAYTAGYVTKKISGDKAHEHYSRVDVRTGEIYQIEPEYATMSRNPGIGSMFYDKFKSDMFPRDLVPVPGKGVFNRAPRYYLDKLEKENPIAAEEIKRIREKFVEEHGEDYGPGMDWSRYLILKAREDLFSKERLE